MWSALYLTQNWSGPEGNSFPLPHFALQPTPWAYSDLHHLFSWHTFKTPMYGLPSLGATDPTLSQVWSVLFHSPPPEMTPSPPCHPPATFSHPLCQKAWGSELAPEGQRMSLCQHSRAGTGSLCWCKGQFGLVLPICSPGCIIGMDTFISIHHSR